MKKQFKKLVLAKETLRSLQEASLKRIAGGETENCGEKSFLVNCTGGYITDGC